MPNIAVGKHQRFCPICGIEFWVGGRLGSINKVCCSRDCARFNRKSNGFIRNDGYKVIRRNLKSVFEHKVVAEQMLGRSLHRGEIVHHINGDKQDNRPENLQVMSQACHRALIDHLAKLWVTDHLTDDGKVAEESKTFQITFTAGG